MSPDTPLFGRLTLGGSKISLGRAGFNILMIRASEQIQKHRIGDDTIIILEASRGKLMDSSSLDRAAVQEHQFNENIITDSNAESPFPGITIGRVAEVMMTHEYVAYEAICDPTKRQGLSQVDIQEITMAYHSIARDCFPHFPKWIP